MQEQIVFDDSVSLAVRSQYPGSTTVDVSLETSHRYIEYVIESVQKIIQCDGILGCNESRCSIRQFRGVELKKAVIARPASIVAAWANNYGAVSLTPRTVLLPARIDWRLHVGCDFSGFFTELLGISDGLRKALATVGSSLSVTGISCSESQLAQLFPQEVRSLRELTASNQTITSSVLTIAHGRSCHQAAAPIIARVMVERAYAPGRDSDIYECARNAAVLWVPNEWSALQFRAAGIAQHIHLIPEAVDHRLFSLDAVSLQEKNDLSSLLSLDTKNTTTILTIAKWEHRKGLDILLDAIFSMNDVELLLHAYVPSWEHVPDRNLQRVADKRKKKVCDHRGNQCGKVKWLGGIELSRIQMRALYARADIFCLPTLGEGWGLPIHEAMAMSLPVVVTNHSGPATLVSQDTGILLPSNGIDPTSGLANGPTIEEITGALTMLINDPEKMQSLGRRARTRVSAMFSPEAVAGIMIDRLYQTASEVLLPNFSSTRIDSSFLHLDDRGFEL